MAAPSIELRRVAAGDRDHAALLALYFAELQRRFGGFAPPSGAELLADAERGVTIVAYDEGRAIACGSLRRLAPSVVEVKRMFVAPEARGRGVARAVLRGLEAVAREMGAARVVLDTAAPLVEAARLYLAEGYVEIARYNDNPYAAKWFAKGLAPS